MRSPDRRRAGSTLTELMVSVGLLVVILMSTGTLSLRASKAFDEGSARAQIDQRAHRALQAIVREFADAGRGDLTPEPLAPLGSETLDYRRATGYAGAVVFGPWMRIVLELEDGELNNGLDDNGNGLIDEGAVVRIEDPGGPAERRNVICSGVREYLAGETANGLDDNGNGLIDERGLSFEIQGDVLTIRLTLETSGVAGRRLERTVQTSVRVLN